MGLGQGGLPVPLYGLLEYLEDKTYLLEEASAGTRHAHTLKIAASSSSISTPLSPA